MKQAALLASSVFALASLGACARPTDHSHSMHSPTDHSMHPQPVSSIGGASSSAQPRPPNSLPEGAAVNAPLTSATGAVSTTTVAPTAGTAAPARRRAP